MKKILALFLLLSASAFAAEDKLATRHNVFEVGPSLAFPTGLGVQLGLWNIGTTSLYARLSLGTSLVGVGADGSFGVLFDDEGDLKQFVGVVGGGYSAFTGLGFTDGAGFVGPEYGVVLGNLVTLSAGPVLNFGKNKTIFGEGNLWPVLPYGKVSVSFFF